MTTYSLLNPFVDGVPKRRHRGSVAAVQFGRSLAWPVTQYDYDLVGNVLDVKHRDDGGTFIVTDTYEYDRLNRQTKHSQANGEVTTYGYDAVDNRTSVNDARNTTSYAYDALNRLKMETVGSGSSQVTRNDEYDKLGNRTKLTDRLHRVTTFSYDALSRKTNEAWLSPIGATVNTIASSYDAAGQLTSIRDASSAYSYAYDKDGRTKSVDNAYTPGVPNVVLTSTYDQANNRTSLAQQNVAAGTAPPTLSYYYDLFNRLYEIAVPLDGFSATGYVDFGYDYASQLTKITRFDPMGVYFDLPTSDYTYDATGRLLVEKHRQGLNILDAFEQEYDSRGRITRTKAIGSHVDLTTTPWPFFHYDDNDQLLKVYKNTNDFPNQTANLIESHVYDVQGNNTVSPTNLAHPAYTVSGQNHVTNDGVYNYTYDAEGNRISRVRIDNASVSDNTVLYTWDQRNRLVGVTNKNANGVVTMRASYTYDLFDRRIGKLVDLDGDTGSQPLLTEKYLYDGQNVLLQFDAAGAQTHRYIHGPLVDQILADETAGDVRFALSDHQGSVRDVVSVNGTWLDRIDYEPFGKVKSETHPELKFHYGYTGREPDPETGLLYQRGRVNDVALQVMMSEDRSGFGGGDFNLYRVVHNNPVLLTDPTGRHAGIANLGGGWSTDNWLSGIPTGRIPRRMELLRYTSNTELTKSISVRVRRVNSQAGSALAEPVDSQN